MQLKHTANAETRVVAHNIHHPDDLQTVEYSGIAVRGLLRPPGRLGRPDRARRASAAGIDYVCHSQPYAATAYGWAMEDEHGFCKVIADANTRLPARRPHHRPRGVDPDPAAGARPAVRTDRRRDGHEARSTRIRALSEVVEQALLEL